MSTIEQLFLQAQLAEAAYANLSPGISGKSFTDALEKSGMSSTQATAFAKEWTVVHQLDDTSSGFSGTLFKNKAGEYFFALRGTAGLSDLNTDINDIVLDGIAHEQIVDMVNYWRSLTHTGAYEAVQLTTLRTETTALNAAYAVSFAVGLLYETDLRASGYIIDYPARLVRQIETVDSSQLSDASLRTGLGFISDTTVVSASGHSLGGHLAMAFSRLFPDTTNNVVAVNGAGFNLGNSNVNALFAALGGAAEFDASKITNAVGSAAMNLVSQDWLVLQQPAGRSEIFTEKMARV